MSAIDRLRVPTGGERALFAKTGAVLLLFAVLPAFAVTDYHLRIFTIIVLFSLFTIALNLIFGHTDQLFLFVGGLAGVGAYTTVLAANDLGVVPWATLPLGVLAAGLLGGVVSYIGAKRDFSVILIAIFTLALQLALIQFFTGAREITGGGVGMPVEDVLVDDDLVFYYLFVAVLAGFFWLYVTVINSRFGLAFEALRQDGLAASSIGIDVVRYKVIAAVLGSMMIGFVGSLYGFWTGYISPGTFEFVSVDVLILIMLTLGGMRTVIGPAVGALVVIWIEETLASYPHWRLVIFGSLLIVLYLYFREGIVPKAGELYEDFASD